MGRSVQSRKGAQIGLFVASYFPSGVPVGPEIDRVINQVTDAEELGFDSIFLGHHYLSSGAFLQPVATLSYLAAVTKRLRLGLGVQLLSLHNPIAVAEELATLNVLSKGRLIAGFGAGYREKEFTAFGIPFTERFIRLEENIKVFAALINGDEVNSSGKFGEIRKARVHLGKSMTAPPVWLGAFGEVGIKRCARLGFSWLAGPEGSEEALRSRLELFRNTAENNSVALPDDNPLVREVYVAETDEEALNHARPYLERQYSDYKSWDHRLSIDDLISRDAVIGSPETVIGKLNRYLALGFTSIIVRSEWPGMPKESTDRSVHLLGREVIPKLS